MNQNLNLLQPYPFQRMRELFADTTPNQQYKAINLSIGEPKHTTPSIIQNALIDHIAGLANYPTTQGSLALRQAISNWATRRYGIPPLDESTEIIPINGSREALFSFAQTIIDTKQSTVPIVISPNPFYQIYEGATLLAGAEPYFINILPEAQHKMDFDTVPESVLQRTQLVYICAPGNPSGKVISLKEWEDIFNLSDRYNFVIAADECYSEVYFEEENPPLGALQAAHQLGRDYTRLVVFSSLSKRSNVPGMRSGFVAGDANIIKQFLLYRTYHGCAMNPAVQAASIIAWDDETHVVENRRLYAEKFNTVVPALQKKWDVEMPDAAFYLWIKTKQADTTLAISLYRDLNITVLPGSFLAREAQGVNPGQNFIRMALVAPFDECMEATNRILNF